jgi:hypothetical protein
MTYAKLHVGIPSKLSNAKIKGELRMSFRAPEDTIADMLDDFVKWGHVDPPKSQ